MAGYDNPMDFADLSPEEIQSRMAEALALETTLNATPFKWPAPSSIPIREWLFGHWILRGEVTAIVAPGGVGKSTISTGIALSLASGRDYLGKGLHQGAQGTWIYNLEDSQEELDRQVTGLGLHHQIGAKDCDERLFVDSGLDQPLCTAKEDRDGFSICEDVFSGIAATIQSRKISVVIVDPFVSSHAVRESSNEAIDALVH